MQAGNLRKRATLQVQSTSQSTSGQAALTWSDVATIWCEISPVSGRESPIGEQMKSATTHKITLRYRSEFADPQASAVYRLVYKGRFFNISAILNQDERNRAIVIQATEGLNDG